MRAAIADCCRPPLAAHERARQLDPQIATSVRHTYWLMGDTTRALDAGGRFYFEAMVLATVGRTDEALQCLRDAERTPRPELLRHFVASLRLLLEHQYAECRVSTEFCIQHFTDPEPLYYMARHLVQLGRDDSRGRGAEPSSCGARVLCCPPR